MGRARNHSRSSVSAATQLTSRRRHRFDSSALHPELDSLWLSHGQDFVAAVALLRRIERLSVGETARLCHTMERVAHAAGLPGMWRLADTDLGTRLAYCSSASERMPDAPNESRWHVLHDIFDGGTIDGLPEPRYLARLTRRLVEQLAA